MKDQICPHCGKLFEKLGIAGHIWRVHTEIGRSFNAKKNYVKGSVKAWNSGLTKETDKRIKGMAQASSNSRKGVPTGIKQSKETKDKISKARLSFLEKNPDKVPYLLNHSSKKSYPEQVFENALIASGIIGWVYNYQNGIYSYDFAFPDLKIDVEIDGATHLTDKVKRIDERRDEFSKSSGWTVIRFTAKEVKKDVISCVKRLREVIAQ